MPLDFANIVDTMMSAGRLDLSRFDFPQIVRDAVATGYGHIEITMDMTHVLPGALTEKTVQRFAEIKKQKKITYSVHLPLWSIEPASPNQDIRKASVQSLADSIELALPLDPECYVLHSTGALAAEFSRLSVNAELKEIINGYMASFAEESVEELLTKTGIDPRKLAVENVEFPWHITRGTVDRLGLSVCFDTGHLLARYSGEISVMEFLETNIDRIAEIHLHDAFHRLEGSHTLRRDHMALGEGNLPTAALLRYLDSQRFRGPLVFELTPEDATRSLQVIRRLCPEVPVE